eukprot:TRINITY_DN3032_c0_g1_i1.p1 TRINITY_DN3032_c0_g1~~TRINITY_DN3032_c0_g1_i1.p1  ORF type:complete len:617 (+),score=222.54 TRINITY_DN3032_c0_g1_i1:46-1896(+)
MAAKETKSNEKDMDKSPEIPSKLPEAPLGMDPKHLKEKERLKKLKALLFPKGSKESDNCIEQLKTINESCQLNEKATKYIKKKLAKKEKDARKKIKSSEAVTIDLLEPKQTLMDSQEYQHLRKSAKIEEEIRKAKLKEVQRMKEELEMKLETLNENVMFLGGSPGPAKGKEVAAISKEEKLKLKEELENKRKDATDFIHKLKQDKKERQKREKDRKKEIEEKLKKESEEFNKKLKEKEEELLKKRKEGEMLKHQKLKQKREEESKKFEEQKSKACLPPRDDYLYKKLEERYNQQVLMPLLEDKKKKLADLRNQYKPVSKEELEEHRRKHELLMAEREENRKQEKKVKRKEEESLQSAIQKLQTGVTERVVTFEAKAKEEKEKKKQEKLRKKEKMQNYASLVKEICPVKPNEEKAMELQKQIERLKHPVRQSKDIRKQYELATINKRSAQGKTTVHSASADKLGKDSGEEGKNANEKGVDAMQKPRHSTSNKSKIALQLAIQQEEQRKKELEKLKKKDYLTDLRKIREDNYGASKPVGHNWESDLQNNKLNPTEKYNRLVGKASLIEEKAKMKEKLLQAKGGAERNPEMGEFVSDMYLDAIKAKLAILEHLQFAQRI